MWKQFLNITINAIKFKWIRLKKGITFLICRQKCYVRWNSSGRENHRNGIDVALDGENATQIGTERKKESVTMEGKKVATHLKFGHRAVNLLWLYHKLVSLMWKSGFSFEFRNKRIIFFPDGWMNASSMAIHSLLFFFSSYFRAHLRCKEQCTSGPQATTTAEKKSKRKKKKLIPWSLKKNCSNRQKC